MVVKLVFTNGMPVPVLLRSRSATDQPLLPQQSVEATFELHEDPRSGTAELVLSVVPQPH